MARSNMLAVSKITYKPCSNICKISTKEFSLFYSMSKYFESCFFRESGTWFDLKAKFQLVRQKLDFSKHKTDLLKFNRKGEKVSKLVHAI